MLMIAFLKMLQYRLICTFALLLCIYFASSVPVENKTKTRLLHENTSESSATTTTGALFNIVTVPCLDGYVAVGSECKKKF